MTYAFFLAMGLLLWVGGLQGARGRDHGRHARRVPGLHGDPADAGAPARHDGQRVRPRLDVGRAAVRGARSRARDRRPARCPRSRRSATPCCASRTSPSPIPARRTRRQAAGDPARHQLRGARRPDARHRRPARQRQVDHRPSDPALLRRRQPAASRSTARTCATSRSPRCAAPSAWCSRTPSCSPPRSRTTSPTAIPGPSASASRSRARWRACTTTSPGLPAGYETLVGERGVSLSGGQRQRLSIARSILLAPPILVFDDSTAAVDAATEQSIREALRTQTATRATIIIAHRLGSLMDADEIVFLEDGRIVERGSHAELLRQGGRYASLYALQSAGGEPRERRHERRARSAYGARGRRRQAQRPPRAVVGSQINTEEQIFAAFDGQIMRRFWQFISPYRRAPGAGRARGPGVRREPDRDPADPAQRDRRRAGRRARRERAAAHARRAGLPGDRQLQLRRQPGPGDPGRRGSPSGC